MYNAAERKDIRQAEKAAKYKETRRREIVGYIMSTPASREWMHDLLADCGVFQTPFAGHDAATNFNCGMQSIGLRLLGDIVAACPDQYIQMMREVGQREEAQKVRQDKGEVQEEEVIYDEADEG